MNKVKVAVVQAYIHKNVQKMRYYRRIVKFNWKY
jgi:hypothetical protein